MTGDDGTVHGKAGFDHLYNRPDPRGYFQTLGALGYEIPQHAHPLFAALLRARGGTAAPGETDSVLDICCSYGVNAALLGCDLTLKDLFIRYSDPSLADLPAEDLVAADRVFFADRRRPDAPRILGLDAAAEAVAYGCQVGLLDAGWGENLETSEPSPELATEVDGVGLITITGGVGYITERTFDRLLGVSSSDQKPWVAAFVLRMYPYDRVVETLAEHGLVTERLTGITFPQRRFESAEEQDVALRGVRARGLETDGKEDEGWYHCDFFLSRPRESAASRPLQDIVAGAALDVAADSALSAVRVDTRTRDG